jgi:hypothetical protein
MDKVDYLEEANRQLTDERFYKKMDSDPTEEFSTKITQELKIMKENGHINKNTFNYLKPDKPKVGRFYLLPKIHKVNNPGCEQLDRTFRWWFFNGSLVPGLSTCFDTVIMWDVSV